MSIEIRTAKELRAGGADGTMHIDGYASTFNQESNDLGGFREKVAPGAFTRSLADTTRDVKATFNHKSDYILGRLQNKTLAINTDDRGLHFRCELNPKSQAHRDLHAAVERGDISECSFAFAAGKGGQSWGEVDDAQGGTYILRTLTDIDLFDVSVVSEPAYPGTSVDARSTVMITPEIRSTLDEMAAAKALAQKSVVAPAVVPPAEQRDVQVLDDEDSLEDYCRDINTALCAKYATTSTDDNPCYGYKYYVVATYEQYVIACECGTEH